MIKINQILKVYIEHYIYMLILCINIYKYDMKIDEELFWNRRENNEEVMEVKIGIWIEANYIPCLDEILIMKPTILPNENIPNFFLI